MLFGNLQQVSEHGSWSQSFSWAQENPNVVIQDCGPHVSASSYLGVVCESLMAVAALFAQSLLSPAGCPHSDLRSSKETRTCHSSCSTFTLVV